MTVLSFCQRRNLAPVAPDQRHLLGAAPSLDPSLRFQCFETCREFLAPDESDRQFVSGKAGDHTRIILAYSSEERRVGNEGVSQRKSRWTRDDKTQKNIQAISSTV